MTTVHIDPAFQKHISHLNLDFLGKSEDVIYIIDNTFKLMAFNEAWCSFAMNNNGKDILKQFLFGTDIAKVCVEPIKSYVVKGYGKALRENVPFAYKYECSSPEICRVFYQTVYPLFGSKGLVITNHLIIESQHSEEGVAFSSRFEDNAKIVTQCSNCGKIRDPQNKEKWYWVPELVKNRLPNISHSICTPCLDHYYPDIDEQ